MGGNASLLLSTFNRKHTSMKENLLPLNTSVYILHINHSPGIGTALNLDHRLHKPQLVDIDSGMSTFIFFPVHICY